MAGKEGVIETRMGNEQTEDIVQTNNTVKDDEQIDEQTEDTAVEEEGMMTETRMEGRQTRGIATGEDTSVGIDIHLEMKKDHPRDLSGVSLTHGV